MKPMLLDSGNLANKSFFAYLSESGLQDMVFYGLPASLLN
jgi:hypothetical protein